MTYKIHFTCRKISFLLALLVSLQPLFAQYDFKALDKELEKKQKLLGNNMVALLWKDDSVIFKKELGDFNIKTQVPIASCSKWLTAALVMQFVDEGKISLDDPVVKYIPIFGNYFKNYITIRHCLSHTTGIEEEGGLVKRLIQRKKYKSLEEEVNDFAAKKSIRANAGTDFWYGNTGLNIVARVLEVVSKKRFDLLIKQKLFNPLGMRKTTFSTLDGSAVNPSGGALSTAEDYMKFLAMLLNKGSFNGQKILSETSVELMRQPQTSKQMIKYTPKSAEGFNYALGSWVLDEIKPAAGEKTGRIAATLASPGLFGTWPMIDFCRGYAYIVFVKNFLGEERADAHLELKNIIDKEIPSSCK